MTTTALPRSLSLRITVHPLALITAVGLALRLVLLGNARLWYDEAGSAWMASLPFDRMLAATAGDAHPPLYLVLLWSWIRVAGAGEAAVRLPSVVASVLCIPLAYAIAQRLQLSRQVALASAALVAVLPAQLYYAQEARMYALLTLLVSLALYAALGRQWWLLGLALAAGYWTHNYGLLFAVPINVVAVAVILRWRPRSWADPLWWLWANVLAFGAWLPWLSVLAGQMREVAAGYWLQAVTPGSVLYALYMIVWAFSPGPGLQAHAALLAYGAITFAAWRAVRARHGAALCCLVFVAIAMAVPVIASQIWTPILLFRGLLPAGIPLCILLAWAFVDGLDARRRAVVWLLVLPTLLIAGALYYVHVPAQKDDAVILNQISWKPGDILYHVNDGTLQLAHIYAPAAWPQYELPAAGWRDAGALSDATRAAYGVQLAPIGELSWRRAWVLYAANPMTAEAEDRAVRALLSSYLHQTIYERRDTMTHQAIYLVWNKGIGVP